MTEDEIQARAKKLVLEYIREGISDRFADVALGDIDDDEDYGLFTDEGVEVVGASLPG